MDIMALSPADGIATTPELQKLKEACDGVEGMFLQILLKEGMKSMLESSDGHSGSALGYAMEQTADEVARNGDTGIADNIYEQLSANL